MRQLSLNPDGTLNILNTENKLYLLVSYVILPSGSCTKPSYYINTKIPYEDRYGFVRFQLSSDDRIHNSYVFTLASSKYQQYSVQRILKMADSVIKTSVYEFESQEEFVAWYKSTKSHEDQPKDI